MKLSDIYKPILEDKDSTRDFEDVTELSDETYEPFTMTVAYWFEAGSHSDHPYGEGSAREEHPADWGITNVTLKSIANHLDENNEIVKAYPVGTDVRKMPGWDLKLQAWYEEKLADEFSE